jgi:hypothetical protein
MTCEVARQLARTGQSVHLVRGWSRLGPVELGYAGRDAGDPEACFDRVSAQVEVGAGRPGRPVRTLPRYERPARDRLRGLGLRRRQDRRRMATGPTGHTRPPRHPAKGGEDVEALLQQITGVVMSVTSHRCHYMPLSPDTGRLEHPRWPILGWAALGQEPYPVRYEEQSGQGVLVGPQFDPPREGFLGALRVGAGLKELGGRRPQGPRPAASRSGG